MNSEVKDRYVKFMNVDCDTRTVPAFTTFVNVCGSGDTGRHRAGPRCASPTGGDEAQRDL